MDVYLGEYEGTVERALKEAKKINLLERIKAHDHTLWKPFPEEIVNRMGWLTPEKMLPQRKTIENFTAKMREDGLTHTLLLGMGGSSLAPEVFRHVFGVREGYLDLTILDSTDPSFIAHLSESVNFNKTLFLVSSKSGTTVETLSFMKYFFRMARIHLGEREAGKHFVAITDPESLLAQQAKEQGFIATFLNDPQIGGRYSALSFFGLVPASLVGANIELLLNRAISAKSKELASEERSSGVKLGVIMGELAKQGRDKLTLILSPALRAFGAWLEQLIAESTGKEGKGVIPIVDEALLDLPSYSQDRLFVFLSLVQEATPTLHPPEVKNFGHPYVSLKITDRYDLGAQCFIWELATIVAAWRMGINPFDQPNVEASKQLAKDLMNKYLSTGKWGDEKPILLKDGIAVTGDMVAATARETLSLFLSQLSPGNYVALQAYLPPTAEIIRELSILRQEIGKHYHIPTTLGFGPRFLHSTGQLHKGDGGKGFFLQFTCDDERDIAIPDGLDSDSSSLTFGLLKAAQASGDREALRHALRRVLHFHLGRDLITNIRKLYR